MNEYHKSITRPEYTTISEVFKEAHCNSLFFDSFAESLKNSWKFYVKKK